MVLVLGEKLVQTMSMDFLAVLNHPEAGVSTNVFLRILHNRAVDLAWIVQPVILKKAWAENSLWPSPQHHLRGAPEDSRRDSAIHSYRLFFELLWETGGSPTGYCESHS